MKVTIRKEEIKAVLSAYFRMDVDDFVISPAQPSSLGKRLRGCVNKPFDLSLKFSNIKALRATLDPMGMHLGLQDGKWAMEHWLEFIVFVDEYNRLPLAGYGSNEALGQLK